MQTLDPTCIDDVAVEFFTTGQCLTLAAVMAEHIGRPVANVYGGTQPLHAVVHMGHGLWADIEGVHTTRELLARWDATDIRKFAGALSPRQAATEFYRTMTYIRPEWEVAELFAKTVASYWQTHTAA